jgi:hypothetical protein
MSRGCRVDARARQRGAILVEAAIITPIVIALVFGMMELGFAYYGRLTIDHMDISGVRSASGGANDVLADFNALKAVKAAETGIPNASVQMVVIYRATSPTDRVPDACKTASVQNTPTTRGCNRYVANDLTLSSDQFGCVGPPGPANKIDRFWCPTTRKSALLADNGNGPPDYVGVYVVATHNNLFGLFGKSFTFARDTVMKIEPRTLR